MPDVTGLKALLMSGRSAGVLPRKKGVDVELELPDSDPRKKKKKGFMDRFMPKGQNEADRAAMETLKKFATPKKK